MPTGVNQTDHIVTAFKDDMNLLSSKGYVMLLEILYDNSNVNPASWLYFRFARYNVPVTFTTDQLGNPGTNVAATYDPFPISDIELRQSMQGEIPGFDIAVSNVGREMTGVLENYHIEQALGRILFVHPDKLSDPTARISEKFVIMSAQANELNVVLTCVGVNFDPLLVTIPAKQMTIDEFPGLVAATTLFV